MIKNKIYKLWIILKLCFTQKKKRFIVCNTPGHGNLGDHAIAKAQFKFLRNYFPNIKIIEVYEDLWDHQSNLFKNYINKNDIILFAGGGYLGDLWPMNEKRCIDIIDSFQNNNIYYFPQTCYYKEILNNEIFITNKTFYNSFKNVKFMTRDRASYDFIENYFVNNTINCRLYPDMVTYMKINIKRKRKKEILVCFRTDHEKITNNNDLNIIKNYANLHDYKVKKTSTVSDKPIKPYERNKELNKILKEFASAELIITDRLHGMLFAAITGTPCIAFDNLSKKVSGVYEWINYLSYIKVVNSNELTKDIIFKYINLENCHYDNNRLIKYFDDMADYIINN